MGRDPELESVAGEALTYALKSFDASLGVPEKRWIALKVKQSVWCYWRSRKIRPSETKEEVWWERVVDLAPSDTKLIVSPEDWQLLCEKHLEKWPNDSIAKRHGWSMRRAKAELEAALQRFLNAYQNAEK